MLAVWFFLYRCLADGSCVIISVCIGVRYCVISQNFLDPLSVYLSVACAVLC